MTLKTLTPLLVPVCGLLLLMIQPTSASESEQQNPTCSASRQPDDSVLYQLSHTRWSSKCRTGWETEDGTNLVSQLEYDPKLVLGVTIRSIRTRNCTTYLRFKWQCTSIREEVICSFDCSTPLPLEDLQPPTVNTTQLCFSEGRCVDSLTFGLIVGIIFVLAVIAGGYKTLRYIIRRRMRPTETRATYTAVDDQVKMEVGQIDIEA